jgi:hypothetical protein
MVAARPFAGELSISCVAPGAAHLRCLTWVTELWRSCIHLCLRRPVSHPGQAAGELRARADPCCSGGQNAGNSTAYMYKFREPSSVEVRTCSDALR